MSLKNEWCYEMNVWFKWNSTLMLFWDDATYRFWDNQRNEQKLRTLKRSILYVHNNSTTFVCRFVFLVWQRALTDVHMRRYESMWWSQLHHVTQNVAMSLFFYSVKICLLFRWRAAWNGGHEVNLQGFFIIFHLYQHPDLSQIWQT